MIQLQSLDTNNYKDIQSKKLKNTLNCNVLNLQSDKRVNVKVINLKHLLQREQRPPQFTFS